MGFILKTDDDQFYTITANTAVRVSINAGGSTPSLGSYAIFDFSTVLVPGTDYIFNRTTGDLEMVTALVAHDSVVAANDGAAPGVGAYTYTAGLGAYVQRVVNGDRTVPEDFPGLKALGTNVLVLAPTVVSETFEVQVVAARGFSDVQLAALATSAIETYVNSLGIGVNIVLSEIVRLVKNIPGVDDVRMILPTTNIAVPDGQIPRITSANITVL